MAGYSMICCVVNMGNASKALKIAKGYGVKGGTISIGWGAVKSSLLTFLGVSEIRKEIITMVVESELAANALQGISKEMRFDKPHHGIAFSFPIAEFIGSKNKIDNNDPSKISEVKNSMYNIIYVVVDKGKGEDVIEAANQAGSKGGTIINARGSGIHETRRFFSVEIEPEKEEVFIITKKEFKSSIVESIKTHMKIEEPGNGIMFVLDVDEVYGLQ